MAAARLGARERGRAAAAGHAHGRAGTEAKAEGHREDGLVLPVRSPLATSCIKCGQDCLDKGAKLIGLSPLLYPSARSNPLFDPATGLVVDPHEVIRRLMATLSAHEYLGPPTEEFEELCVEPFLSIAVSFATLQLIDTARKTACKPRSQRRNSNCRHSVRE